MFEELTAIHVIHVVISLGFMTGAGFCVRKGYTDLLIFFCTMLIWWELRSVWSF